jgi:hypothetical protein
MTLRRFHGPLRVCPDNPRYFTDDTGRAIYLTGSHTWANLLEMRGEGDPLFDYPAFLDLLEGHGHTFMRMWTWDHPSVAPWTDDPVTFDPMPHARTGPGMALDGQPRFDLGQWNEAYFMRLRERVQQAGDRGIYVSVMLFEGWCVKWSVPSSDAWQTHPYNKHNNINAVDGDPDGDGRADVYSLDVPAALEYQTRYVQKVIDTVGDLDNVLWEIANETPNEARAFAWQAHMIDAIHAYERDRPKQHPVGMTAEGGSQDNAILFASPADWISPGNGSHQHYRFDPPAADGTKVILSDTDHLWGHGGTYRWVWRSFLRGLNPIFMDPWGPVPGRTRSGYASQILNVRDYPEWEPLRAAMGHTRALAEELDLRTLVPHNDLASSGYCLAHPGVTYLAYAPEDHGVRMDLRDAAGNFTAEWYAVRTGERVGGVPVAGGSWQTFTSPIGMDVVLILRAVAT